MDLAPFSSPFDVYRVLRILNPSPYMFYLKMGEEVITGASPELLVRVAPAERWRRDPLREPAPVEGRPRRMRDWRPSFCRMKRSEPTVMLIDLGANDLDASAVTERCA